MLLPCVSITYAPRYDDPYDIYDHDKRARQVLNEMSLDEKIGQLFMIPVYTERSGYHKKEIKDVIEKYHLGGVIFMKGHPHKQYLWTREFQKASKFPLLVAMDAEWGPNMRLDSTIKLPKQMTLGAVQDLDLVRRSAVASAQQLRSLGVNVSFSPVVDINSNPENPVIHMRSFGEDKKEVADRAIQYMHGLQENGILSVAKHFPGHGDTHIDSHLDLPEVQHSKRRIAKVELYPFSRVFEMGIGATMTAHLKIPALQKEEDLPGSLSERITTRLLRKDLDFEGLVFSDALNMQAVTKYVDEDEIDIKAFKAGNDILLFPRSVEKATQRIKQDVESGEIKVHEIDDKVLRIIKAKLWMREQNSADDSVKTKAQTTAELYSGSILTVNQEVGEQAITRLNTNSKRGAPSLSDTLLVLSFGSDKQMEFHTSLEFYAPIKVIHIPHNGTAVPELNRELWSAYNNCVISLFNVNPYRVQSNFGYHKSTFELIDSMCGMMPHATLVNFGTPYLLNKISINNEIIQAYEELPEIQLAAAEAIFDAIEASGKLPVGAGTHTFDDGDQTRATNVLRYGMPEQEGLNSENLQRIDSIALKAIADGATPGCQILVAKNNRVIYQKGFGKHTYKGNSSVLNSDIYDVASITKVMASTMLAMRFYEMGFLKLDKTLEEYLGSQVDSTKLTLSIKEIMTHQSGLSAWIPFYKYTLTEGGYCDSNYCYAPNDFFAIPVADSLYTHLGIKDTIYKLINGSKMKVRGEYLYSDLGYFYLMEIFNGFNVGQPHEYLRNNFYAPLGMRYTLYNPLNTYQKSEIVPTERDNYFRHQLVHGYVHDPAAAMLGGVAGHAGIFSNANDIAKLFQMLLNEGSYNKMNFFEPATVKLFTSKQYENNRKGLGFDKPEKRPDKPGPTIDDVSASAFGHTGFTGTCVWADPEHGLIYVFLSNRVHPTANNVKLIRNNVRTDILQVIYDDLKATGN